LKIGFSSSTMFEIAALPHSKQVFPSFFSFFIALPPRACLVTIVLW
jgi:hypothetical protein